MFFCLPQTKVYRAPVKEAGEDATEATVEDLESGHHAPVTSPVLLELVGATGLTFSKHGIDVDPYCLVRIGKKEVHRTKPVSNDTSPIWTLKSKCLCIIDVGESDTVTVEVRHGLYEVLGAVHLSCHDLLASNGARTEFKLNKKRPNAVLAMRFRPANEKDYAFLKGVQERPMYLSERGHAADVDFRNVEYKSMLSFSTKTIKRPDGTKEKAFRVLPGPDPDNPRGTTFLTKEQMHEEAKKPSKKWVESGYGKYGTLFLEILGCDNLPNMDIKAVNGLTDAFVSCVFEDSLVRTSIIHDSLNPRWMPWSTRAFMFQILHPSSILRLGIFDYDEGPMDLHDPIGRIAINLEQFESGTVYTLEYPLFEGDSQSEADQHGTITIRLRIHWNDEIAAMKARSFVRPPRIMLNTKTERSWRVLRYVTRGNVDMTEATLASVKLYGSELFSYFKKYCYLLDVLAGILLWRGRLKVWGNTTIWFPIHSIFIFTVAVVSLENPELIPSMFLYTIAYVLLATNFYASTHPSPWRRIPSYTQTTRVNLIGPSSRHSVIPPGKGTGETKQLDLLDTYKGERVYRFIIEFMMTSLRVYRLYSKTMPFDLSTTDASGTFMKSLYGNKLNYIFMFLRYNCKIIRLIRKFVNWQMNSTFQVTTYCLLLGTIWMFFPFRTEAYWVVRLFVWLTLGPWAKLLDMFWIHKYYRTKEELLADGIPETVEEMHKDITERPNILDPILRSNWVQDLGYSGRIVAEENLKLKDVREKVHGKWSEMVPVVDNGRFQSIPLQSSFAQPYSSYEDEAHPQEAFVDCPEVLQRWLYVPGQKLSGHMIPQPKENPIRSVRYSYGRR